MTTQTADLPLILTRREVASILRVSTATVIALVRRGELEELRVTPGNPRYRRRDVLAYMGETE